MSVPLQTLKNFVKSVQSYYNQRNGVRLRVRPGPTILYFVQKIRDLPYEELCRLKEEALTFSACKEANQVNAYLGLKFDTITLL